MMINESFIPKYRIFNPQDPNCPVCATINSLNGVDSLQTKREIPQIAGKGYYSKILVKPAMIITISDMSFHEKLTLGENQDNSTYGLSFCLGETFRWKMEGSKNEYTIERGENCIFSKYQGRGICYFNPGERFWGLSIQLDAAIITGLLRHLGKKRFRAELFCGSDIFYKTKFSSVIQRILHEIINCHYRDDVKRIYLEGKILELLAVYLNESILESGTADSSVRLNKSDRQALYQAKKILDQNITAPPMLTGLARLVCLNEYKLKNGFKELFGMTVHAYVIDKRLELARYLLEEQKLGVLEAVLAVGYSDASHFAVKFRKKFGINPSEYKK
jgi:AraC-like DNA-binding protein